MNGEKSSPKRLQGLRHLNFQSNSGLLCLLETDQNVPNPQEDRQDKNDSEKTEVNAQNGSADDVASSGSASQGNKTSTSTVPDSATNPCDIDLVGKVSRAIGQNKSIANKCRVYVGNICYKVRRREFRRFFSSFGKVLCAEIVEDRHKKRSRGSFGKVLFAGIVEDRHKKRSRGFGFITFSNEWEAQKAKDAAEEERTLNYRVMSVMSPKMKKKGGPVQKEQSLEDALEEFRKFSLTQQDNSESISTEESAAPRISTLNDDIIIHIFSFLGVKDRIRIERVCTRWKYVVLSVWPSVTHLDFKDIFSLYKGGLTDDILLGIFQRGCKNLKSLDLSASPFLLTDFAVHCIAKHCKGLKKINLSGVKVSTSSLRTLAKACNKLETVIMQKCYKAGEKGLWWIFKECTKLKHIDVSDNKRLTGKCFFMLPPTVESLNLSDCSKLTNSGAAFIGNLCRNLKSIDMTGCASFTDAAIVDLLSCTQIEKIYFRNCPQTVTSAGLELMISRLTQLMVLDLSMCSAVDDDILLHLGQSSSNLTSLNIQGCHGNITDVGIQSLVSCNKLQNLVISYIDGITNMSISQLAYNGTLQAFIARSCDGISDEVIKSLLENCLSLNELDLSGCDNITDTSLVHVRTFFATPSDRCLLTLVIGGTIITEESIAKTRDECNQLDIITHDLSCESLRLGNQRFSSMPQFFNESDDEEDDDDDDEYGYDEHGYDDDRMGGDEYDDFLVADDPSLMMDEEEWMFNNN